MPAAGSGSGIVLGCQPSPGSTARRIAAVLSPPTMIGGQGVGWLARVVAYCDRNGQATRRWG